MPAASSEVERPNRPATPIRDRGPACAFIRKVPSPRSRRAATPLPLTCNDALSVAAGIFVMYECTMPITIARSTPTPTAVALRNFQFESGRYRRNRNRCVEQERGDGGNDPRIGVRGGIGLNAGGRLRGQSNQDRGEHNTDHRKNESSERLRHPPVGLSRHVPMNGDARRKPGVADSGHAKSASQKAIASR